MAQPGWCVVVLTVVLASVSSEVRRAGAAETEAKATTRQQKEGLELFETRIRPLLARHCYGCHSARATEVRGSLRLDSREGWQAGGDSGPVIVPGEPDESLLIEAVRYETEGFEMPPSGKLSSREIADLERWVALGAPDPRDKPDAATDGPADLETARERWPFVRLQPIDPPQVRQADWCRTPIDRFILARLEQAGIAPAPEADRRRLLRRAYLDLIGLPPTPEQTAAFLADEAPDAYERLVDRLLQSPHYGERWARYWLDIVRFAESHGFEHDTDRPYAYHYRDFVIRAWNDDLPYDTFVRWQLAGDEYEPENNLALTATGYLAAGVHSTQITKNQAEKERYDELDDILATTGTAMLGLTLGCARCHDHKFDPVTTHEYYRMLSTFTTTVRHQAKLPVDREKYRREKQRFEAARAPLVAAVEAFEREQLAGRFDAWEKQLGDPRSVFTWTVPEVVETKSEGGAAFEPLGDGSLLVTGNRAEHDIYTVVVETHLPVLRALRIEALAHPSLVHGGPGRADNGNFALTDLSVSLQPLGQRVDAAKLVLTEARATFEQKGLPVAAVIDDNPTSGWAVDPEFGKSHAASFTLKEPVEIGPQGARLTLVLKFNNNVGHSIGRLRIGLASAEAEPLTATPIPESVLRLLDIARDARSDEQRRALLDWYRTIDPEWQTLHAALERHEAERPQPETFTALISSEGVPAVRLHTQGPDFYEETYFLERGDLSRKQGVATQGFLRVLMAPGAKATDWWVDPPAGWHTSYRRRALAEWITDVDRGAGHLLARVIVNRLWQHHFGRGIVATPNDFGSQGEPPTHPELLDWLAGRLIAEGWRLKPIHRLIMHSAVYRQVSTRADAEQVAERDADNRLWSRYEVRRLEAEAIRDSMLAIGGLLDRRMFGPGTLDRSSRRRSIYFTIKRSQLIPMMTLFDAPDALASIGRRPATVVAPQALLMMNAPQVRACAEGFAKRLERGGHTQDEEFVSAAFVTALARAPTNEELQASLRFLKEQTNEYQKAGSDEAVRLARADFCQTLLSLNEVIYFD